MLLAIALMVVGSSVWSAVQRRRRRASMAHDFGEPVRKDRDMERVALLFRLREDSLGDAALDDQTWSDLDLDAVFDRIDRTLSWPGMQCLYLRMRTSGHSAQGRATLDVAAEFFTSRPQRRAWYRQQLDSLGAWHASALASLFFGAAPPVPWFDRWLMALSAASMASVVAIPFWPPVFVASIAFALSNLLLKTLLKERIEAWFPALRSLPGFLRVVDAFADQGDDELAPALDRLREERRSLGRLRRPSRWAGFDSDPENVVSDSIGDVVRAGRELINLLFLLDVTAFYAVARRLGETRAAAQRAFLAVGAVDEAISLASLRHGRRWTRPHPGPERTLRAVALVHPLVAAPVPATFAIDRHSWIVTGSNMSGKSTFLRSVGIAAVMADSLGTVLAEVWESPTYRVRTSIGRSDSVLAGTSYYLAEVDRVKVLLTAAEQEETSSLFLLDELFRGTNTIERVAAAHAVLEHLDRAPHLVMVATHDVELLDLLRGRYDPWHFRESVSDRDLTFDYQLRAGACSSRNAIALLRLRGFPASVVEMADASASRDPMAPATSGRERPTQVAEEQDQSRLSSG